MSEFFAHLKDPAIDAFVKRKIREESVKLPALEKDLSDRFHYQPLQNIPAEQVAQFRDRGYRVLRVLQDDTVRRWMDEEFSQSTYPHSRRVVAARYAAQKNL